MANSSSCCCSGLPKGWWWLLTLVGLPLLYFSMLTSKLSPIEDDLEARTIQNLSGEGFESAQINIDKYGRDLHLSGQAATAEERDKIIKIATETGGVRTVDGSGIKVQALTDTASEEKQSSVDTNTIAMEPEVAASTVEKVDVEKEAADKEAAELAEKEAEEKEAAAELAEKEAEEKEAAELAEKEAADKEAAELAEKEAEEKEAAAEKEEAEKEEAVEKEEENAIVEKCQKKIDSETKGKVVLFGNNSTTIKDESFALLDNVSDVVKECEDAFENKTLRISGHTDSRGKDEYNLSLSKRRADAVKTYLKKAGIDSSFMESKGYGETQPIASNSDSSGRAKNRRITFSIE